MEMNLFDYQALAKEYSLPRNVLTSIEKQVKDEFPNDAMMRELHVIRAIKAYANKRSLAVA
jgi:hypothetical protein